MIDLFNYIMNWSIHMRYSSILNTQTKLLTPVMGQILCIACFSWHAVVPPTVESYLHNRSYGARIVTSYRFNSFLLLLFLLHRHHPLVLFIIPSFSFLFVTTVMKEFRQASNHLINRKNKGQRDGIDLGAMVEDGAKASDVDTRRFVGESTAWFKDAETSTGLPFG